jgi:S-adenosylmethionine synthetase
MKKDIYKKIQETSDYELFRFVQEYQIATEALSATDMLFLTEVGNSVEETSYSGVERTRLVELAYTAHDEGFDFDKFMTKINSFKKIML